MILTEAVLKRMANRIEFGQEIVETDSAIALVQYRFPRSKKRRIKEKWAKNRNNYRILPTCYKFGDVFVAHPEYLAEVRRKIK